MKATNPRKWYYFKTTLGYFFFHSETSKIIQISYEMYQQLIKNSHFENSSGMLGLERTLLQSTPAPQKTTLDIQSIALNVIEKCNLNCHYCYAQGGTYGNSSVMSFETAKKAILFFSKPLPHPLHIKFFGGEPLLNSELIYKVINWCHSQAKYKYHFSITTNGTLLNQKHLDFFKENQVKMTLSYDGKKVGSKQRPMKPRINGYSKIVQYKLDKYAQDFKKLPSFYIRSTITELSINYITELIEEVLKRREFSLGATLVSEKKIDVSQIGKKFIDALEQVCHYFIERKQYESIMNLVNIRTHLRQINRGAPTSGFCGAGIHYLSISSEGKFYLCHRFTEDKNNCIGDIDSGLQTEKLQQIIQYRENPGSTCSSCWVKNHCRGGCFHENQTGNNNIFQIDPFHCELLKKEFTIALKAYVYIKKETPHLLSCL